MTVTANGETYEITAFLGRTKRSVEQALSEFAKSHVILRTEYEYNSTMHPSNRHAMWVAYQNKETTNEETT